MLQVHPRGLSNLQAGPYVSTETFSTHGFARDLFYDILFFILAVIS